MYTFPGQKKPPNSQERNPLILIIFVGKFVVDVDKNIDINDVTPNCRVALRNDSYTLHKILPNKVRKNCMLLFFV